MYPPDCDYYRAESIGAALELLADHAAADPALLAGGQGLVTAMKTGEAAPGVLVDIGHLEDLRGIDADGAGITVGALTRHADLGAAGPVSERVPVLGAAAARVGDRQIRNRGTIGGNLAEANPAADLPAAVLAADGTLVARGPDGQRRVDARAFFKGDGETALGDREILIAVRFPADGHGGAYVKRIHPASGYALVGVAAAVDGDDGRVRSARVAATGVADRAFRLPSVESALTGTAGNADTVARAAPRAASDLDTDRLVSDPWASGTFRAEVLPTYVERALGQALGRNGGGE